MSTRQMPENLNTVESDGRPRHWYDGLPTVSAEVDCGGARHRITWRRGRLVLEHHDALAEQSLVALGGRPPMCVELLEAWRAQRGSDLLYELLLSDGTLTPTELAQRKASHQAELESADRMPRRVLTQPGDEPRTAQRARLVRRQAAERVEQERQTWAVTLTEALPLSLRRALGLSVIVNIERHWDDDAFRRRHARHVEPALTALATPLFEQCARRWRRSRNPYAGIGARAWLLAPDEPPACAVYSDRSGLYAALSLPLSWFTEVWGRGIALVDGCFVMGVADGSADGTRLRVLAVQLERRFWRPARLVQRPAVVTRGGGGGWRLRWA